MSEEITYLPTPTQLEKDIAAKNEAVSSIAQALNHLASVLQTEGAKIYSLPADRFIAVLNADIERNEAIMQSHLQLGGMVNQYLDRMGSDRYTSRAPVAIPRSDFTKNEDGDYIPIDPEPEAEPEE